MFNKYTSLAVTCSLEHLTALLAELLLSTDAGQEVLRRMAPSHRALWIWHAVEETEHKAVAYDVYCAVGGGYLWRIYRHILTSIIFFLVVFGVYFRFMWDNNRLFDLYAHWQLFYFLYISPGMFRKAIPLWLVYLKPNFHPWDNDNRDIIEEWIGSNALKDLKIVAAATSTSTTQSS
jgi:hypothetical protein